MAEINNQKAAMQKTKYKPLVFDLWSKRECFLGLLFITTMLLSLPYFSAKPITLSNLSVETQDSWCFNKSYQIKITPLSQDNISVDIDKLEVSIINPDITYQRFVTIFDPDLKVYTSTIKIESNNQSNETYFNLSIKTEQSGKILESLKQISLKGDCESDILKPLIKIDEFISENSSTLVIFFLFAVFVIVVFGVIIFLKKKT